MKLIPCKTWREASQKTGAHVFYAPDVEEAKRQMKLKHPGIVPDACYWHENRSKLDGSKLWNSYYFCVEVTGG